MGGVEAIAGRMAEVEEQVREYAGGRTRPIGGRYLSPASFIDGSFACSERRGCVYTLLSSASIRVDGMPPSASESLPGARRPLDTILFPKKYYELRVSLLMRLLETLAGLWELRGGSQLIVMDGSYLTLLLTPYNVPFERIGCGGLRAGASGARSILDSIAGGDTESYYEAARALLRIHGNVVETSRSAEEILCSSLQLLLSLLFEASSMLLDEAYKGDTPVIWVSKDTESYLLMKAAGVENLFSDIVTLDDVWAESEDVYMVLDPERPLTRIPGMPGLRDILEKFYSRWGTYTAAYAKFGLQGAPLQVTLPARMAGSIDDVVETLRVLSDSRYGYPAPLIHVHHLAVLRRGLADTLANELWSRSTGAVQRLMAPRGRVLYGLPG